MTTGSSQPSVVKYGVSVNALDGVGGEPEEEGIVLAVGDGVTIKGTPDGGVAGVPSVAKSATRVSSASLINVVFPVRRPKR